MGDVIITHGDLDGAGCVVVLCAALKKNPVFLDEAGIHVYSANYDNIDQVIQKVMSEPVDHIYITDITPSEQVCAQLHEVGSKVTLIDHHKTKAFVKSYPWAIFDTSLSATELTFKFVEADLVSAPSYTNIHWKHFAQSVTAWDMWQLNSLFRRRGARLNILHGFWGSERFIVRFGNPLADLDPGVSETITILEEKRGAFIHTIIKQQANPPKYQMDSTGRTYVVLIASEHSAPLAHTILSMEPDVHYVIVANTRFNNCSIYSRDDGPDVSEIAKRLRGGGHAHAAGFSVALRHSIIEKITEVLSGV